MLLVAELATSFHGDLALAEDMIRMAADNGADYVKTQAYDPAKINPNDPQAQWLRESAIDRRGHERLMKQAKACGVKYLSTPFDRESLIMLRKVGLHEFKAASSDALTRLSWYSIEDTFWFVSWPWGKGPSSGFMLHGCNVIHGLTAIPLYPTPLECVGKATLLDGWSDHCESTAACQWAIAQGIKVLEVHVCLPGRSRVTQFDKSFAQLQQLKRFSEDCETMRTGVKEQYRKRWTA